MLTAATTLLTAATTAPEESSSFIVSPALGLMIWTLVTFFIALFILNKLAFPKIAAAIDARREATEGAMAHADATRKEADDLLAEYRERLAEARVQADEIVARSRKAADTRDAEAKTASAAERAEMLAQTKNEIELETQRALQDLRREVANLTVIATEKITRKSLNQEDQQRLVEEALSEVDFSALAGGASKN
ncbi:MAG: F0F1 ATP synthase subunit B [Thermoleophilaceae bacterium]|nr:F0F1 ATP synthase subunit B [Thermoleophilaceae bacterium]